MELPQNVLQKVLHNRVLKELMLTMVAHMLVITHENHIQHCFHLPYRPRACDAIILTGHIYFTVKHFHDD